MSYNNLQKKLTEDGEFDMYVNDDRYAGTATLAADPDKPCLVCGAIRTEYSGNISDHLDAVRSLNDEFDHTLGAECILRTQAERNAHVDIDELVRKHG